VTEMLGSYERRGDRPALVLGGGGGFGVVQAAYIQAAHELGFRPQVVVGTSVGALNGAWVAMHPSAPEGLLDVWSKLRSQKLLRLNPVRLASRIVRRGGGICANELVPKLIAEHIRDVRFEDTELQLAVVATNLSQGRKHVFRSGGLADAVLASTAIPGVFDPVPLGGHLYVDGCVTAPLDFASAVEMGATEILAIDLTPSHTPGKPRTAIGVLARSMAILAHSSTDAMLAFAEREMPTRMLCPDLSRHSAWRIAVSEDDLQLCLREARAALRGALDANGHVVPAQTSVPAISAELAPRRLSKVRMRRAPGLGQAS
jgi:NTE family protein